MEKFGKFKAQRGVDTTQLRGGITQQDMIRLEMLKKNFFLDYKNVDKFLS